MGRWGAGEGEPGGRTTGGEIDEELRFHLEGRAEELMASGLGREEAERLALAAFGDVTRVRSELQTIDAALWRSRRRREWIGGFWRDMRAGMRRLRRAPGYTVVAVSTLALGIGVTVAMFTVLNGVVLRPLPYPSPDRLVRVWPAENFNITLSRSVGSALTSLSSYTGISHWGMTLTGEGAGTVVDAAVVDAGYFDVFGVRPLLGRAFGPEETEPSRSGVVLLGHGMWQTRFGADPSVIGRRVRLSGYDHEEREIIGVMPEGHQTLGQTADVWIPLHVAAGRDVASDSSWYVNELVGRLAPAATVERTDASIRAVAARLREEYPGRIDEETQRAASATGLLDSVVGDVRSTLWLLLAAVSLVLLIACGNLANLLLARASTRRGEMGIQAALGASRWRLVRQHVAEGSVVAALGAGLGVILAQWLLAVVRVSESSGLPRAAQLGLDWRVLGFAVAATAGALLLFGVLPAVRATSGVLRDGLGSGVRGGSMSGSTHRLNRVLVSAELAMATVLTTTAALVLAGFATLRSTDPGIDTADVLAVEILPPRDTYQGDRYIQYIEDVREGLAALPGAGTVGAIHLLPFTFNNWSFPYLAEGHAPPSDGPLPTANFRMVTPGYFDAVDQPLLRGRRLDASDRDGAQRVMLINRSLAEALWPGQDAIGREIQVFGNMSHRVVGVVGDVRQHALDREPNPEMYVPLAQWTSGGAAVVFMIEGPGALGLAAEARAAVAGIDRDVPIIEVQPLRNALDASLDRQRFVVVVLAAFCALALLLGGIGVYGVMSHLVGARLPDFGLRLALGARPAEVAREALGTGMVPALAGLAIGAVIAVATAGVARALLPAAQPLSLKAFVAVALVMLGVAGAASWLPARRAARADPLSVMRAD